MGTCGAFLRGATGARMLFGLLGLLGIGLTAGSVVLAIIGLVECAAQKERWRQGRPQAIWALVLNGVFGLLLVAGAVRGSSRGLALSRQPTAGTPIREEAFNFQFDPPGRPWVQADAATLNREAKLAFLRSQPEVYLAAARVFLKRRRILCAISMAIAKTTLCSPNRCWMRRACRRR